MHCTMWLSLKRPRMCEICYTQMLGNSLWEKVHDFTYWKLRILTEVLTIRRVHPQSDSHHKLSCKCSSLYCCMLFGELRLWFILSRKLGTENWIWQDFSLKGFIDRACHTPHQRSKEIRGNACWVLLLYTVSATCYSLFMTSCMPIAVISCHCLIFLFV